MGYRIAYDVKNCKVGCVLIQAALSDLPSHLFWKYFGDSNGWTVNAGACRVYTITEEQLPVLAAKTDFSRESQDG